VLHREVAHVDDLWKKNGPLSQGVQEGRQALSSRSVHTQITLSSRSDHAMRVSVKRAQGVPGETL
jgi:hypothetical protein